MKKTLSFFTPIVFTLLDLFGVLDDVANISRPPVGQYWFSREVLLLVFALLIVLWAIDFQKATKTLKSKDTNLNSMTITSYESIFFIFSLLCVIVIFIS